MSELYLGYFDEVKFNPPNDKYFRFGAILVKGNALTEIDAECEKLAATFFGTSNLTKETEFHAIKILGNKHPYKGREIEERISLYKELLSLIGSRDDCLLVSIRIDVDSIKFASEKERHHERALMFLVERVNGVMKQKDGVAVMVADKDDEKVSSNVFTFSQFKQFGAPLAFGQQITNVRDTIHHTDSAHSRLLQLADIYTHTINLMGRDIASLKYPQSQVVEHARSLEHFGPKSYKRWPPS